MKFTVKQKGNLFQNCVQFNLKIGSVKMKMRRFNHLTYLQNNVKIGKQTLFIYWKCGIQTKIKILKFKWQKSNFKKCQFIIWSKYSKYFSGELK